MTTLETINALQIVVLVCIGVILYTIGFLHGAFWGKRNRVRDNTF